VQTDIVIAVTPRVLRAPAITPNDEELRPSGTLSTPTTGSLEALVLEANREDQLAAARKVPTNSVVQLPDVEVAGYVPAPKAMVDSAAATPSTQANTVADALAKMVPANIGPSTSSSLANTLATSLGQPAKNVMPTAGNISAKSDGSALLNAATAAGVVEPLKSPEALLHQAINPASAAEISDDGSAPPMVGATSSSSEVMLMAEKSEFKVGERQRVALVLNSSTVLTPAIFRIKFDPKVLTVKGVSRTGTDSTGAPGVMNSIDPAGYVMAAVTPLNGAVLKAGSNIVLYLDVEAVGAGNTTLTFDKGNVHLMGANGREVAAKFTDSRVVVK
jgi:hypothetical protein